MQKSLSVVVLSNTCDMSPNNARKFLSNIVYAPTVNLRKYINGLTKVGKWSKSSIDAHVDSIRKQLVTQIFYLPKINEDIEEQIVFLDQALSYPSKHIDRDTLDRTFTLSNYGIYILVFKLSVHFCRITDGVNRG